ncbi:MAG: hypothetical protein QOJ46_652 [bacterium]
MDDEQDTLLSRRRLLAAGAVAAAGVVLPETNASAKGLFARARPAKLPRYSRTGYRRARFTPHVGTPVKLRPRGGLAVRGTLASIEDVPYVKGLVGDQDAYSLRFRGPATPVLPEGIAGIRHKHFGVVELYVTPLPSDGVSQDYLAVINRRVPRNARHASRRARV